MKKKQYPITATFIDEISMDIETSNWTKKDWHKDLKAMKSVGIDTIILIRGGIGHQCIYHSKHFGSCFDDENDLLRNLLESSEKLGIKVYIGLYMCNPTWDNGNYKKMRDDNEIFINEILERYGNYKSFIGWYIPTEVCKIEFNIIETQSALIKLIKEKTPDKKIYWCPLFRSTVLEPNDAFSYEQTFEVWKEILGKIEGKVDSMSFTDGTAPLEMLDGYLKASKEACDLYGIEYWSNVELFDRIRPSIFTPIKFEVLKKKIAIHQKYSVKLNSFEFSHFMSPNSIFPSGKALFKRYKKYYGKGKY